MFSVSLDRSRKAFGLFQSLSLEACRSLKLTFLSCINTLSLGETYTEADLTPSDSSAALSNGFDSINSLIIKLRRAFGTGWNAPTCVCGISKDLYRAVGRIILCGVGDNWRCIGAATQGSFAVILCGKALNSQWGGNCKLQSWWLNPSTNKLKWWFEFTLRTKAGSFGFCGGRHLNLLARRKKLPLPNMSPDAGCKVQ